MAVAAIKKQPAEQLAADALKHSILTGTLRPGERLTEMALADQLAVSRGTVRSALHQLNGDGLVVLIPYTGWAVTTIRRHDIWEIFTLRASLEGLAARLTAQRLGEDGRQRLCEARDVFFAACGQPDVTAAVEHDFGLHRCIVELAGNGRLACQYRLVEQQVRFFINSTYGSAPDLTVAVAHHTPIVDAILLGEAYAAERHSAHHIQSEGERLLSLMDPDP